MSEPTVVQLVQSAWEAGRAGDSVRAQQLGVRAARVDYVRVTTNQTLRGLRQELAAALREIRGCTCGTPKDTNA